MAVSLKKGMLWYINLTDLLMFVGQVNLSFGDVEK